MIYSLHDRSGNSEDRNTYKLIQSQTHCPSEQRTDGKIPSSVFGLQFTICYITSPGLRFLH